MNPETSPSLVAAQDRADAEESFVPDLRAALRPSQRVEQKLVEALRSSPLLLSHLESRRLPNSR